MRSFSFIFIAVMLCACVPVQQATPRLQVFNEADHAWALEKGTSIVIGEAFLRTRGGGIHTGAGRLVGLIPATPYTTEVYERQFIPRASLTPPIDKRLDHYSRFATADSRGEFRFEQLPAGTYYLECLITWEVPRMNRFNASDIYMEETGAMAIGQVTVGSGETKRVVVTR